MFFRRGKKDKPDTPSEAPAAAPASVTATEAADSPDDPVAAIAEANAALAATGAAPPAVIHLPAVSVEPLVASAHGQTVDAKALGFETTADLEPAVLPAGQEAARDAFDFGASMKYYASMTGALDYNILVTAPTAATALEFARRASAARTTDLPPPSDWVLVAPDGEGARLRPVALPAGRSAEFCRVVAEAADEFSALRVAALSGEDYEARLRTIEVEARSSRDGALARLEQEAEEQAIALLRTPTGFALAPMHDGRIVKSDVFAGLPPSMQNEIRERIGALETRLTAILDGTPGAERLRRSALRDLAHTTVAPLARLVLADLRAAFPAESAVTSAIDAIEARLIAEAVAGALAPLPANRHGRGPGRAMRRHAPYAIAVLPDAAPRQHAPVVEDLVPTAGSLLGYLDPDPAGRPRLTPGSLHRANGGILILEAAALLDEPAAWIALKRALVTGQAAFGASPFAADHDPIPLALKVVITGTAETCRHLAELDAALTSLFKVEIALAATAEASPETYAALAGQIAGTVARYGLRHLEAAAVARLIEEATQQAAEPGRIALDPTALTDLAREADHVAGRDDASLIGHAHVERALAAREARSRRARSSLA